MFGLTHCDFCGGPANWTFRGGDLFYYCKRECDGFKQVEMFADRGLTPEPGIRRLDTRVSVSGMEGDEGDVTIPF